MDWIPIVFVIFKGTILFTGMFYAIKWHYDQDKKEQKEGAGPQSRTEMRLFATMIIALGLSLIGVVYAGCWGDVAEGGRGGAVACAFTLLMFIMSKPDAEAILKDSQGQADLGQSEELDQVARLKIQAEHVRTAFLVRLETAEREKIYLCVASVISVLAWKFGDIAAAALNSGH